MTKEDTKAGTRFSIANGGTATIVKYNGSLDVLVELSLGLTKTVTIRDLRLGCIKDKMIPSVYGVGFIGNGEHKSRLNGNKTTKYKCWVRMLERCYHNDIRHISYKDCSICDEWHNFQNFAKWHEDNYIEGFELDKDIKVKGNRIYSPATCLFVSQRENKVEAKATNHRFISPLGERVDVYNLTEFCRDNGLTQSNMCNVHSGKRSHHKGWTKA